MSDPISSNPLGDDPVDSNEPDYVGQLGRISGKLLSANLVRNGVDLYFKNSDAVDALLHLDVSGMRIGINTDPSAPIYTVDVNLDILSKNAEATSNLYVDNFSISANATVSTLGDIIISPTGPGAQSLFNAWGTESILFDNNQLYSINDNDIVFTPDGIGTVELEASTNITGNLYVTGTINIDGDLSTIENITVGDDNAEDLLTFLAKFSSDLTPDSDIAFDLGDGSFRWNDFYSNQIIAATGISTGNISLSSPATIESVSGDLIFNLSGGDKFTSFTNGLSTAKFLIQHNRIKSNIDEDLQLEASGTGKVSLNNDTDFLGNLSIFGSIQMDGDLSTTSNIIIGDEPTDVVTFNTDLNQDILPKTTLTYDLGKSDFRWQNAYIDDWRYITNINTDLAIVDGRMLLGGNNNISALTGNDDLVLTPSSGLIVVEEIQFGGVTDLFYSTLTINNPNPFGTSANDNFGYEVDVFGNRFIVGAPFEDETGSSSSGKAYIFNTDTGALVHTLDNPNAFGTPTNDLFGLTVAISQSYALVGAPNEDETGSSSSGKAYIFNTDTGALVHTLDNPNAYGTSASDTFGVSLDISETYAVVAARESDVGGTNSGKVYVFDVATGSLLRTIDNPNAFGTSADDRFFQVAINGDKLIVGAEREDEPGFSNSGKAYIFDVTDGSLLHTLDNPNAFGTPAVDFFGTSVAISENYAIVGALFESDSNGIAYIFDVHTGNLLHTLNNPDSFTISGQLPSFGQTVAISDLYAVVGASGADSPNQDSGKIHVFDATTGALVQSFSNPNAFSTPLGDKFGWRVSISGATIVVGVPDEDDASGLGSGKAYAILSTLGAPNDIVNLNTSTPLTFTSTGIGYYQFQGDNGFVIPAGDTASRPSSPEVGDTRWNTDEQYLECFDGSIYIISIGPGDGLTVSVVEDLNTIYSLMLG